MYHVYRSSSLSRADQIEPNAEEEDEPVRDGLQTFVFSATLSKDLQRNVKRRSRPQTAAKYHRREAPASTLGKPKWFSRFFSSQPRQTIFSSALTFAIPSQRSSILARREG